MVRLQCRTVLCILGVPERSINLARNRMVTATYEADQVTLEVVHLTLCQECYSKFCTVASPRNCTLDSGPMWNLRMSGWLDKRHLIDPWMPFTGPVITSFVLPYRAAAGTTHGDHCRNTGHGTTCEEGMIAWRLCAN
jgi:hypothetical protein